MCSVEKETTGRRVGGCATGRGKFTRDFRERGGGKGMRGKSKGQREREGGGGGEEGRKGRRRGKEGNGYDSAQLGKRPGSEPAVLDESDGEGWAMAAEGSRPL